MPTKTVTIAQEVYDDLVSRALPRLVLTPSPDAQELAATTEPAPTQAVTEVRRQITRKATQQARKPQPPKPAPPITVE